MESVWRVACVRIPRFPIGAVWQEQRKRAEGSEQQGVATKSMIGTQIPLPFPLQTRDNIHAPERDGVRNPISDERNGTQSGSRTTDPRQSTPNPQSPLRSPQSAIRNPKSSVRSPQSEIFRPFLRQRGMTCPLASSTHSGYARYRKERRAGEFGQE